jgi:O-antigen/teichoic acid export membrane protein
METVLSGLFRGLKGRILADAAARVWGAVLSFALAPVYLRFVGVEAYGLIGVFISIQTLLALLDFGLGASLTRELARTSGSDSDWVRARNLTRTLEVVYWGLAALAALIFFLLVPWIADKWLNPEKLTADEVRASLYVGAAAIAVQWASTLYVGGLLGLQKQQALALVGIIATTVRAAATIAVLWGISPTVQAMFWVQAVVGLVNTLVLVWLLWVSLPGPKTKPIFQAELFADIWKFATGVSAITLASLVLTQADKIILSRLLTLETLGYYVLASTLASGLYILVTPILGAIFPRLSELATPGKEADLAAFYHFASQLLSVVALPMAAVFAFFATQLLFAWTGNHQYAENATWIAILLVAGNGLNGVLNAQYALNLASGWTSLAFYVNAIGVVVFVPLLVAFFAAYGVLGAASAWPLLNLAGFLTWPQATHRFLLRTELTQWYLIDVGPALLISLLVAGSCSWIFPHPDSRIGAMTVILCSLALSMSAAAAVAPLVRARCLQLLFGDV